MGNKQGRQGGRRGKDDNVSGSGSITSGPSSNPVGVSISQSSSPVSGTPYVTVNHFNPENQPTQHSGSTLQPTIGTKPSINTTSSPNPAATATDLASPLTSPTTDLPIARASIPSEKPLATLPLPDGVPINEEYYSEKFKMKIDVDDFELLKVVGKGSFGKVMQVRKRDNGKIYAMKVLKKQQLIARKQVAHTKTERKVLEEIDHPFIVSLRYAFQTESKLYMILDYFTGGELFFHLKSNGRFTEERARFYAAEITLALECLHKHTIVYRDLKPENVLLDEEGHIRLTDFGLSKEGVSHTVMTHTFCGTPEYLAPEVIHGAGYGLAVDWWSLGTLLYEMLTGLPPFYNQNLHVMYEKIIRAKLHFPAYLSPEARSLLTALLERNPRARLGGVNDAEDVKKHPFFAGIDWTALYNKRVTAPFRPTTTEGALDVTNVDDEFKKETPKDTPVIPSTLRSKGGSINFPGFSFAPPESLMTQSTLATSQDVLS